MSNSNFKKSPQGLCKASGTVPDSNLINRVLASARKKQRAGHLIIIARTSWLQNTNTIMPVNMPLANLCVVVKNEALDRAFFSSTMTHVIKKQNYYIQILNGSSSNTRKPKSI
jgi:hypothetical protein